MEDEPTQPEINQRKLSLRSLKYPVLPSPGTSPRGHPLCAFRNRKMSSASLLLKKPRKDAAKTLKSVSALVKHSLKNLRPNDKENLQKRANATFANHKPADFCGKERPSPNSTRLYSDKNGGGATDGPNPVVNCKKGRSKKFNLVIDNLYKAESNGRSYAVPSIYGISAGTDTVLRNGRRSLTAKEEPGLAFNETISGEKRDTGQEKDASRQKLYNGLEAVVADTNGDAGNGNNSFGLLLTGKEERNTSDICSRSLKMLTAETTCLSTGEAKTKSSKGVNLCSDIFAPERTVFPSANGDATRQMPTPSFEPGLKSNTQRDRDSTNHIKLVAANTNRGGFRSYNEDRISVVLNIKGNNDTKYSYFGVFDGHAGAGCSEFLKENLHKYIIAQKNLLDNFEENITRTFKLVDELFKEKALPQGDRSGSCALTMFYSKGEIKFANVGDCRAIASLCNGQEVRQLTVDHRPENPDEKARVLNSGGYFYATNTVILKKDEQKVISGPLRVFPGKLTTTRSFGDFEAKLPDRGGLEGVVISEPEFAAYPVKDIDFVVLGCDGLYENITNQEIIDFVQEELSLLREQGQELTKSTSDALVKRLVDHVIEHGSSDNVSAVILFFERFVAGFGPQATN